MGIFSKNKRTAPRPYVPPSGLIASPTGPIRVAPYIRVGSRKPAHELGGMVSGQNEYVSLLKGGFDATLKALKDVGLDGLRGEVIVLVDDSDSIRNQWDAILQLVVLYLGAALNISASGKITVLVYGRLHEQPIIIDRSNYHDVKNLIKPTWRGTPMAEALLKAIELAKGNKCLTIVGNMTDGMPNSTVAMDNAVITASGHPLLIKNLATRPVKYLVDIDDMPSLVEYQKNGNDEPIYRGGKLVLYRNPDGKRFFDAVDSKTVADPFRVQPADFALAFADEIIPSTQVMGSIGLLSGVPNGDFIGVNRIPERV